MNRLFRQYWWLFLVKGLFAVILGILALLMTAATFAGLVIFIGAFILIDGIISLITILSTRRTIRDRGWILALSILGILIGIITFLSPFIIAATIIYLVAFWAIIAGVAEILIAWRIRKEIKGEGWYIAAGILSIAFGILVMINPVAGAFTITVLFGIFILMLGAMLITLSFRLRKRHIRWTELWRTA